MYRLTRFSFLFILLFGSAHYAFAQKTGQVTPLLYKGMTVQQAEAVLKISAMSSPVLKSDHYTRAYQAAIFPDKVVELDSVSEIVKRGNTIDIVWRVTDWRIREEQSGEFLRPIAEEKQDISRILKKGMTFSEVKEALEVYGQSLPLGSLFYHTLCVRSFRYPDKEIWLHMADKDGKSCLDTWDIRRRTKGMRSFMMLDLAPKGSHNPLFPLDDMGMVSRH